MTDEDRYLDFLDIRRPPRRRESLLSFCRRCFKKIGHIMIGGRKSCPICRRAVDIQ